MSLQIIEWLDFLESPCEQSEECAVTIGVFDGLHLGHKELINRVIAHGPNPTVITFRENPKKVISPETYEGDIFSLRQKIAAFESLGVSRLILIDFSGKMSKLKGRDFIDLLEDRIKVNFMAIGSNFRCGYRQDTDANLIREINERKGIATEVLSPVIMPVSFGNGQELNSADTGSAFSSSRIRSEIISGNIKQAAALMGRNIELDLSDLTPVSGRREEQDGLVYDLCSVHRITPASGHFPVLIYPGAIAGYADADNGKIFLSKPKHCCSEFDSPVERIEFIN